MSAAGPHVMIIIDTANEMAQFHGGVRTVHMDEHVNFVLPWFKVAGCEPVTKPVHFLDSPFTFEEIDIKAIVTGVTKDFVKEHKVIIPGCGKGSNIINV